MRYALGSMTVLLLLVLAACSASDVEDADDVEAAEPTAPSERERETPTPEETAAPEPAGELDWEDVVELMEPSTVMIRSDFPETAVSYEGQGSGTGIVYSEDGYILTNAHVVSGAAALTVATAGSSDERSARFVGVSPCDDLAVIQVTNTNDLQAATLGDSAQERVGSEVATLGYPLGDMLSLDVSFSRGVISKLDESLWEFENLIQHDAAINPGNSGGPLVNRMGEVVGVNVGSFDPSVASDINYAIAIDQAKPIVSDLESGENRLWLGMNLEPNFYPDYFGTEEGLVVSAVASGSSASSVGVQPAYLLTHLQGLAVNSMEDVCRVLRSHQEGDSVSVEFMNITDTEIQFLEGEVVLGGDRDGEVVEVVYSETYAGETAEETADDTAEPTAVPDTAATDEPDESTEGSDVQPTEEELTTGTWIGVAEVSVDYWAPCGEDDEWIHYDTLTYEMESTVAVHAAYESEANPFMLEVYADVALGDFLSGDPTEGAFWMVSSWRHSEDEVTEYWALENDGAEIYGELFEYNIEGNEFGNFLGTYMTIDPCSDAQGSEYVEHQLETESYVIGYLGEEVGFIEMGGMTADLFRDFYITIELERVQ